MARGGKTNRLILFWRDVSIAAGQVTFGVLAATWFVPPFDQAKAIVLLSNGVATLVFLIMGFSFVKRL